MAFARVFGLAFGRGFTSSVLGNSVTIGGVIGAEDVVKNESKKVEGKKVKPTFKKIPVKFTGHKHVKGFTLPKAISIRERKIQKFDEMNLMPEFLPQWYLDVVEARKQKLFLKLEKEANPEAYPIKKEKKVYTGIVISHELIKIILAQGPMSTKELLPKLQKIDPSLSRTRLIHILKPLRTSSKIKMKTKDSKNFVMHLTLTKVPKDLKSDVVIHADKYKNL